MSNDGKLKFQTVQLDLNIKEESIKTDLEKFLEKSEKLPKLIAPDGLSSSPIHPVVPDLMIKNEMRDFFCKSAKLGFFNLETFISVIDGAQYTGKYNEINEAIDKLIDVWGKYWKDDNKKDFVKNSAVELQIGLIAYKREYRDSIHVENLIKKLEKFLSMADINRIGKIFISYPRYKKEYVLKLKKILEHEYFPVWFDESIRPGDYWEQTIGKEIEECSIMIVVMTPRGEISEWVNKEIDIGIELEKRIVPLLLEGEIFKKLKNFQSEDVTKKPEKLPDIKFIDNLQKILWET